jgi:hypothetical protein
LSGSIYTGEETRAQGVIGATGNYPTNPFDFKVFRADATAGTNYTGVNYVETSVIGTLGTTGSISLLPALYYLPDATRSSAFIGLHPAPATAGGTFNEAAQTVTYAALDGSWDIMCSEFGQGHKGGGTNPSLKFYHLLTKITVVVKVEGTTDAERQDLANSWGAVTGIAFDDKKEDVVVTLPAVATTSDHGAATVPTASTVDLPLRNPSTNVVASSVALPNTATGITYGYAMIAPGAFGLKLLITTANTPGITHEVAVPSQPWDAGYGYLINVLFKDDNTALFQGVQATGELQGWNDTPHGSPIPGSL